MIIFSISQLKHSLQAALLLLYSSNIFNFIRLSTIKLKIVFWAKHIVNNPCFYKKTKKNEPKSLNEFIDMNLYIFIEETGRIVDFLSENSWFFKPVFFVKIERYLLNKQQKW